MCLGLSHDPGAITVCGLNRRPTISVKGSKSGHIGESYSLAFKSDSS